METNQLSESILENEIKTIISDLRTLTENEIFNTGFVQRMKNNLLPKIVSNISEEQLTKSILKLQEETFIKISNQFNEVGIKNQNSDEMKNRFLEGMEFQELGLNDMANQTFLKVV